MELECFFRVYEILGLIFRVREKVGYRNIEVNKLQLDRWFKNSQGDIFYGFLVGVEVLGNKKMQ